MHQQPTAERSPRDVLQARILQFLLSPTTPAMWSVDEIVLEAGDWDNTHEAVARLHASGLVHVCEGFVFGTRAAQRAHQLIG